MTISFIVAYVVLCAILIPLAVWVIVTIARGL